MRVRVTLIAEADDGSDARRIADHVVYFSESYNFMVEGLNTIELERLEVIE